LYQNFTLDAGEYYLISALHVEGDSVINFFINDANSGVNIEDGAHLFQGDGQARSVGIFIDTLGTIKSVVDSIRLVHVANPNIDFTASPDPLVIDYDPS